MTTRLSLTLAAIAAATAAAFAGAQQHNYVAEPVASVAAGAQGDAFKGIVDALNAEAALKGSKITLVPDGDVLVLTGVTVTRDQMKRALEIAGSQAPGGKVANAITSEQLEIVQQPVAVAAAETGTEAAATEAGAATPEGATAAESNTPAASAASEVIQPATPGEEPILPATAAPQSAASRT